MVKWQFSIFAGFMAITATGLLAVPVITKQPGIVMDLVGQASGSSHSTGGDEQQCQAPASRGMLIVSETVNEVMAITYFLHISGGRLEASLRC